MERHSTSLIRSSDVKILLSLPGVGRVISATMLAEASQPLALKLPPRGFFDRIHNQQQVGVKGALHSFSSFTVTFSILHSTYRADLLPNGLHVIADIIAVRCLDRARHLREQAKERATFRIFEAAGSLVVSIRADTADSRPDDGLQFFQRAFHGASFSDDDGARREPMAPSFSDDDGARREPMARGRYQSPFQQIGKAQTRNLGDFSSAIWRIGGFHA